MKKLIFFFIVIASALCSWQARAEVQVVTGIEVVVTDAVITKGEIDGDVAELAPAAERVSANDPVRFQQEVRKIVDSSIEQRIEEKLILHDFIASKTTNE